MKKIFTIGRGDGADIIVDDQLVSRRHATIRLLPFGKMEIRDLSKNGTYVNGIRLAVNKPYPITRKDIVSFARVNQLDWKDIPDPMKPYKIGALALLIVIVLLIGYGIFSRLSDSRSGNNDEIEQFDQPNEPEKKENGKNADRDGDNGKDEKNVDGKFSDKDKPEGSIFPKAKKKAGNTEANPPKSDNRNKQKSDADKSKTDEGAQKDQPTHWL